MLPIRPTPVICAFLLLCTALGAQQQEVNDAGGSLRSQGVDPVPGSPFVVSGNSSLVLEVGGNPVVPYALVMGALAQTSLAIPQWNGQFLDLDLGQPLLVWGDGFGPGGLLPSVLFSLNASGQAIWNIPLSPAATNQRFAFQALVADPAQASLINATAAGEWLVSDALILQGSEVGSYTLPNGAQTIYGQTFSSLTVSTSGWVAFGPTFSNPDFTVSSSTFTSGTLGSSLASQPVACPLWTALSFSTAQARVEAREIVPGLVQIDWIDGARLVSTSPGTLGSFGCMLDFNASTVTFDYTQLSPAIGSPPTIPFPGFTDTLVGLTDGGTASSTVNELDLADATGVLPFAAPGPQTLFQNFGTGPFAEPVDLAGLVLTFVDVSPGLGEYVLF